jgi:hypothetical protein
MRNGLQSDGVFLLFTAKAIPGKERELKKLSSKRLTSGPGCAALGETALVSPFSLIPPSPAPARRLRGRRRSPF